MNLLSTLRIALNALRVNMLRSLLTMLGIIIGVAAVITMIAVGGGAQARVEEQMRSLGANVMVIMPGSTTASGIRLGYGAAQSLTEDDARAITAEVEQVEFAAPRLFSTGQIIAGGVNWATSIQGITPDFLETREWKLVAGRGFEAAELSGSAKVAIIGQAVMQQLFGEGSTPEAALDQQIRVRNVPMTVVGVLDVKGQNAQGQDQDDVVFVPLSTARNRIIGSNWGRLRRVHNITIKVRPGADMKVAEDNIRALMRQRHRLQPGTEDDFTIRNLTEMLQAQEESSRILSLLLAAVASVSLLVGGIGIMNIMLVSVTERTREIGVRMAVGARGRDIQLQFLVEALVLSMAGGLIGVGLGLGIAWRLAAAFGWSVLVRPDVIGLAVGFSALVGVGFGFWPALKASRLDPITALRFE